MHKQILLMFFRCKYLNVAHGQAGLTDSSHTQPKHWDLDDAQIARSEACVTSCMSAFMGFLNPFTIEDRSGLYNISSGVKVSPQIEKDLLQAKDLGEQKKNEFIKERLKVDDKFFDPIKKLNLLTMASC